MKRIILILIVLTGCAKAKPALDPVPRASDLAPRTGMLLQFYEDGNGTTPIITVSTAVTGAPADQVIVRTFYRTMLEGQSILLSRTSVIPFVPGEAFPVDPVPAKKDKIAWIEMTAVKNAQTDTFLSSELPEQGADRPAGRAGKARRVHH